MPRDQLQKGIHVEGIEIIAQTAIGELIPLAASGYMPYIVALAPVVTVRTQYAAEGIKHPVLVGDCVDGEPVEEVETQIVLGNTVNQVLPAEYKLAGDRPQGPIVHSIMIFMYGQCLAAREIRLLHNMPACTNTQGQIDNDWSGTGCDFDREAEELLQHANVA